MDYEKAYNEALERARKQKAEYQKGLNDCEDKSSQLAHTFMCGIAALEMAFPELAESEDERIRKWIFEKVQGYANSGIPCSDEIQTANKALAYLEKQKEQNEITIKQVYKEFINSEKLKGAKTNKYIRAQLLWELMHNGIITEVDYQYLIDDNRKPWTQEEYRKAYQDGFKVSEQLNQKERKPMDFPLKDKVFSIMKKLNALNFKFKFGSDEERLVNEITSEMRDLSDRFNLQSKQEWSEEDEKDMAHIIRILDDCYAYGRHDLSKTDHENLVNKLKSLRPQSKRDCKDCAMFLNGECTKPHWKPREDMIKALEKAIVRIHSTEDIPILTELRDKLRAL